ncbi:MAG: hypothetical protein HUK24_05825 [Sphaerochaetaceae bacterium]|nr:hypothetical protein [Sphaerochaetaceae bacterium]
MICDVFMFMGQSNMAGRAKVSEKWPQVAPKVIPGAGYEFRAISDPSKLYVMEEPFGKYENRIDGIYDVKNDELRKSGSLVTSFTNAYFSLTQVPVVGISASKGGSAISQWVPGSDFLKDSINRLEMCKAFLKKENIGIRHIFILWCQGESDGDRHTSKADYFAMFKNIMNEMSKHGVEHCFLIRIGRCNDPERLDCYDDMILWQDELVSVCKGVSLVSRLFSTMRERSLMPDKFHYYQHAYNEVGEDAGKNAGAIVLAKNSELDLISQK